MMDNGGDHMELLTTALLECKVILKTKYITIFLLLVTAFLIIDCIQYYQLAQTHIEESVLAFRDFGFSIEHWVQLENESIYESLRALNPYTSFTKPIYIFSATSIIFFIVLSSIFMGIEYRNKTIRVRLSYLSPIYFFIIKLISNSMIYILFFLYATFISSMSNFILWNKLTMDYSYFIDLFDFGFHLNILYNVKEFLLFILLSTIIISFYSLISFLITYYTEITSLGLSTMILPFLRINSTLGVIILVPMFTYYTSLSKIITDKQIGFYGFPDLYIKSLNFAQLLILWISLLFIIFLILIYVKYKKKLI